MIHTCLNCGHTIQENYCSHCGQHTDTRRLTWHGLLEEVFHFFTHIEKGFLRTVKTLVILPGKLYKEYLDGKRKTYHKPISFLFIWIAIYLLIFHLVARHTDFENKNTSTLFSNDAATSAVITQYRSIIEILILPFTACVSWLFVGRPKLYYAEVLTVSFYTISFLFMLLSAQFLASYAFHINYKTNTFDLATLLLFLCWVLYAGYDFYKHYQVRWLLPRMFVSLFINAVLYFFLEKMIVSIILKI